MTQCPLYRRLGVHESLSGRLRKISPSPGSDPRTVQPVASLYTDSVIPTHDRQDHNVNNRNHNYSFTQLTIQWDNTPLYCRTGTRADVSIFHFIMVRWWHSSVIENILKSERRYRSSSRNTRWFKYDWDKLWLVYIQIVPVIFEPPCIKMHWKPSCSMLTDRHDEVNSCFSQRCKRAKNGYRFYTQNLKTRNHTGELCFDGRTGRMVLKCILREQDLMTWGEFVWHRIITIGRLLWARRLVSGIGLVRTKFVFRDYFNVWLTRLIIKVNVSADLKSVDMSWHLRDETRQIIFKKNCFLPHN